MTFQRNTVHSTSRIEGPQHYLKFQTNTESSKHQETQTLWNGITSQKNLD